MFIGLSYETLVALIVVAIFVSVLLCLAFNNLKQLFRACCCRKRSEFRTIRIDRENEFRLPGPDSTVEGSRTSDISSSSRGDSTTGSSLTPLVERSVSVLPVSALSEGSADVQKGSQNFMKILKEIEALDESSREVAIERERRRRRQLLAEEQRLSSRTTSSASGVIEANSSDETSSQTLIGLPSDAAPQDPGTIQLGLIVAQEQSSSSMET